MQTNSKIRYYTQAAVLIALAIVVRRLTIPQGHSFGLNLGGLPIILAGFTLGPWGGALVGAVSDVLGIFFSNTGYTPLLTITSALTGLIPAGVMLTFPKAERLHWKHVGAAVATGQLITKVWVVPLFMNLAFHTPIRPMALNNLVMELWHIPLYTVILIALLKSYRNAFDREPAILQ